MSGVRENNLEKIKRMTGVAMFAALAYVAVVVLRIPNISGFLTLDFKDAIITIAAMCFGPWASPVLSVTVPFIEAITISGTGPYGFFMNFASSFSFSFTASLIYKYRKTFSGALTGLLSAIFAMVSVMLLFNLFVTPLYMGVSTADVAKMIPKTLLPFNLIKAVINASLTMALYKPLISALRKIGFIKKKETHLANTDGNKKNIIRSVVVTLSALAVTAAALCLMLAVLGGKISFFDVFKK